MNSSGAGRIYFNTDTLPERDRFPAFCEEFVRRRTALDIVRRGEGPFRGVMDLLRAGPVVVGSHFSTPTDLARSPLLVRDGDDSLLVALCRSGVAYLTQLGANLKLEPGSAFVCDSGYAGEVRITADTGNNSIVIYSNMEDYRIIERALHDIDRPKLQVAIEATVAEVTLTDDLQYGVQNYLTSSNLGMAADKGSAGIFPSTTAPLAVP